MYFNGNTIQEEEPHKHLAQFFSEHWNNHENILAKARN